MPKFYRNRFTLGSIPQLDAVVPTFFSPKDVSGLQVWLDANQLIGLSNGDAVQTWTDMGTLGKNATQATQANRPIYTTNVINGKPALRATGSHWMTLPSTDIRTVIQVVMHESYTELNGIFCERGLDKENIRLGGSSTYIVSEDSNGFYYSGGSIKINNVSTYTISLNTAHMITAKRASNRTFATDIFRGAYAAIRHMRGYIAEVIIYNTDVSSADLLKIYNYLKEKYNLS